LLIDAILVFLDLALFLGLLLLHLLTASLLS